MLVSHGEPLGAEGAGGDPRLGRGCVRAVGFLGLDQGERAVGEHGVVAVGGEPAVLVLGVRVRDPADQQPCGDVLGFRREVNAVKAVSATSASLTHRPVSSSNTASVYLIIVQAVSSIPSIARRTARSCRAVIENLLPVRALRRAGRLFAQPGRGDHRPGAVCGQCCDQRVQSLDPGVAAAGALLVVSVGLAHRVIDIDVGQFGRAGQQRAQPAQAYQRPGVDGVDGLAEVTED